METMDVFAWGVVLTLLLSVINSILTVGLTGVVIVWCVKRR